MPLGRTASKWLVSWFMAYEFGVAHYSKARSE